MSEFENIPPELTRFEASLSRLNPAAIRIDRDRLMFRLGQSSREAGRLRMLWPAATVALAILSGALGLRLAAEDSPQMVVVEPNRSTDDERKPLKSYSPELAALDADLMAMPELRIRSFAGTVKRSTIEGTEASPPRGSSPATATPPLRIGDRQMWREWLEEGA